MVLCKERLMNNKGFTLAEVLVSVGIWGFIMSVLIICLQLMYNIEKRSSSGIEVGINVTRGLKIVSEELVLSNESKVSVIDGVNGAIDSIRFSIPIVCDDDMLGVGASVQYWGAPLRWGCDNSTCMDADNNCSTNDYRSIEYKVNEAGYLVRRVLDGSDSLVGEEKIMAINITGLQMSIAGTNVINVRMTAEYGGIDKIVGTMEANIIMQN